MGQAGKALRQVLETYGISQNQVAVKMGIGRSNVYRWVNEVRDPGAEMVLQLRDRLEDCKRLPNKRTPDFTSSKFYLMPAPDLCDSP
jgi:transcriptional regulator with XRE-family HTH domain